MSATILATGPVPELAERLLEQFGRLVVAPSDDEETLVRLAGNTVAFVVRGGSRITERLIDAAPDLRVIARSGVGYDDVDVEAATRRRIPVVLTPDAGAPAVAEGALALMLGLAKRLPELGESVRAGRWADRDRIEIGDLAGAMLGIVGAGRIGRRVADLATAFGMEIGGHDPYAGECPFPLVGLEELVAKSDFLSIHAPLTEETRGMIDAHLLAKTRSGLILINLSRGGLVRSLDDLLEALESGRLGGVGLDVFEPEPPPGGHALFRHPRVMVTPHALGLSRSARRRIFEQVAEGIEAVFEGRRPAAVANPSVYTDS
jgi:D-3-phosphoglycerate dehydrogenase / 2-oxoglutarate reductase